MPAGLFHRRNLSGHDLRILALGDTVSVKQNPFWEFTVLCSEGNQQIIHKEFESVDDLS